MPSAVTVKIKVEASRLGKPRRVEAIGIPGMRSRRGRTLRGFHFDGGAIHGLVGGEAVEINQKLGASRDRNQLERVRCRLAARRDIAGYGCGLRLVVMAFVRQRGA